jgi:hypothetical protein
MIFFVLLSLINIGFLYLWYKKPGIYIYFILMVVLFVKKDDRLRGVDMFYSSCSSESISSSNGK